jgi:hypothetical protein
MATDVIEPEILRPEKAGGITLTIEYSPGPGTWEVWLHEGDPGDETHAVQIARGPSRERVIERAKKSLARLAHSLFTASHDAKGPF